MKLLRDCLTLCKKTKYVKQFTEMFNNLFNIYFTSDDNDNVKFKFKTSEVSYETKTLAKQKPQIFIINIICIILEYVICRHIKEKYKGELLSKYCSIYDISFFRNDGKIKYVLFFFILICIFKSTNLTNSIYKKNREQTFHLDYVEEHVHAFGIFFPVTKEGRNLVSFHSYFSFFFFFKQKILIIK